MNFGIEVEFLSKSPMDALVDGVVEAFNTNGAISGSIVTVEKKLFKYCNETRCKYNLSVAYGTYVDVWTILEDRSVSDSKNSEAKGYELVSPVLQGTNELKDFISTLKYLDCYTNDTSGIHIHTDNRFSGIQLRDLLLKVFKKQEKILKKFKVPENRLSYCKAYPEDFISKFKKVFCGKFDKRDIIRFTNTQLGAGKSILYEKNPARYYLVNIISLTTHNTLEYRFFTSTLSINEIKEDVLWVETFEKRFV